MIELFEHQKIGIEFLKKAHKSILADEMGMGKTRQAIIAAKESGIEGEGVLIVCPASLKINWKREIGIVYPKDEVQIIDSLTDNIFLSPRWHIINYDILEKWWGHLEVLMGSGTRTLILDEAHYLKGKSIRATCIIGGKMKKKDGTWITVKEGLASKADRVYLLTGTPLLNRPIELFNLLKAIDHPLGKVRYKFARQFCGAFRRQIWNKYAGRMVTIMDESGASNLHILREELKPYMLRRKKEDVLDLPDKMISVAEVELNEAQQKVYDTAWDDYVEFLEQNPMPERNIDNIMMAKQLVEIQKLKQVCSKAKVSRVAQDVENAVEQGEKVIVFSQYKETIRMMAEEMEGRNIGYETLTGEDDMEERQKAIDSFQGQTYKKVFIANIKAGGVGLNLTAASIVMFCDMEWSPETHNQAIDRAHRIGQERMVNAYFYICSGTIEDDIIEILNSKKGVLDKVMEGKSDTIKEESVQKEFLRRMAGKVD